VRGRNERPTAYRCSDATFNDTTYRRRLKQNEEQHYQSLIGAPNHTLSILRRDKIDVTTRVSLTVTPLVPKDIHLSIVILMRVCIENVVKNRVP